MKGREVSSDAIWKKKKLITVSKESEINQSQLGSRVWFLLEKGENEGGPRIFKKSRNKALRVLRQLLIIAAHVAAQQALTC